MPDISTLSLIELTEPLFECICRLNRSVRGKGRSEQAPVKAEITSILADMKAKAAATPGLLEQYEKIELVLLFFVDFMIKESALPFAKEWKELAFERNELAGDEKFFDLLEETLQDRSRAATDRLAVFYTCLGLGFTGWYAGQPEFLRRKSKEIFARIADIRETQTEARICPEAYDGVDPRNLVEPPSARLTGIGIALLVLLLVLFIANIWCYQQAVHQLVRDFRAVIAS